MSYLNSLGSFRCRLPATRNLLGIYPPYVKLQVGYAPYSSSLSSLAERLLFRPYSRSLLAIAV
ncbi:hypothetical protein DVQ41_04160 [Yersinia enterocolitica]|nr:hypothetical protein [Yersinia enterocolitica]QBP98837.1 hypothetical protein YEY1_08600 [Yersinia enterocolitica subsp. palearctica]EKN4926426.1 hypothetical protein [Yersinia enterocolitica]EKN4930493.1 hypothetical protein [Yersinia enterocolitica]EKN5012712.1 hypothetical protein [Yersinia enterocolitica]